MWRAATLVAGALALARPTGPRPALLALRSELVQDPAADATTVAADATTVAADATTVTATNATNSSNATEEVSAGPDWQFEAFGPPPATLEEAMQHLDKIEEEVKNLDLLAV